MQAYLLALHFPYQGKEEILYPVLLQNEKENILVDTGYPGFMPLLEKALQQHNVSFRDLTGVLITHHDMDHMGALAELKEKYPHLTVYSSSVEAGYISGQVKSARLQQAEDLQPKLPEDQRAGGLAFQEFLRSLTPVPVDVTFNPEEKPELFKGAVVIPTPGHSPGHFSLYLPDTETLIAGDAVVLENGELNIANPEFTLDLSQAVTSVNRLSQLKIKHLICFHGGLVQDNVQAKLQALVAKYS